MTGPGWRAGPDRRKPHCPGCRPGRGAGTVRADGRAVASAASVTPAITPAMVARSRIGRRSAVVARRASRLAWIDSLRRPRRPRRRRRPTGRRRRSSSPPTCGVGGGYVLGRATTSSSSRPPTAGSVVVARRRRRRAGADAATAGPLAPAVSARGEVAFAHRARRRVRHRDRAARRLARGRCASRTPTTRGIRRGRPTASLLAWHEWDLPDMPWDASRIVVPRRRRRRRRSSRAATRSRSASPASRPTATGSRSSPTPTGWPTMLDRRHRRRERAAGARASTASTPSRRGARGSARTRGRPTANELAWCRNEDGFGRLVIGAPGRRSARELSKGWHRGLDWGDGGIACVRSGAVTPGAGRRARGERFRPPRDRARAGRRLRGDRRSSSRAPVTWKSGSATVHGLLWRPPRPRRRGRRCSCSVHGGPTGQALADWNAARAVRSCSAAGPCCSRTTAARRATARAYAQALDGPVGRARRRRRRRRDPARR